MSLDMDKELNAIAITNNARNDAFQLLQAVFLTSERNTIEGQENSEFERIPDIEDFSYLSFLIIIWIRKYHEFIDVKYITSVHSKLIIEKKIGSKALDWFIKTFELLTLKTLSIIDNDTLNYWIINLYF